MHVFLIVPGTMRREGLSLATCWPAVRVPFQSGFSMQDRHLPVSLSVRLPAIRPSVRPTDRPSTNVGISHRFGSQTSVMYLSGAAGLAGELVVSCGPQGVWTR